MFTESFDVKKWDILRGLDEKILDDYADRWQDRQDTPQQQREHHDRQPEKDADKKSSKIDTLGNDISSKTGEYWNFFNNFPNGFHETMSWLSFGQKMTELKEANRWVPEKKIKWFDKTFEDGKSVEVREEAGDITFNFFDKWKNNSTTITLKNFQNIGKKWQNWETLATPSISIIWDLENLPDPIKKVANKIDWTINLTEDNAEVFKEVFDSLHENIMRPQIEEFHGYVDNIKKKTEDLLCKIELTNIDKIENIENIDITRWNHCIDSLVKDIINDRNDLIAHQIAVALIAWHICITMDHPGITNTTPILQNRMKEILWYSDSDWVEQKGTLNKDEDSIEFIPVDEFFVANGNALINLAIDYCKNNQTERSEEIINFLTL